MREYRFSLVRILSYKVKIYNFVLIRENAVSENPYCRIFYAVNDLIKYLQYASIKT